MRQMHLVGFLQAQNCTNLASSWRHPESRTDFLSADYYQEIGRVLEAGKFDLGFFDDRLSMPDRYGGDHVHTVEHGIRCVKLDPVVVLTMMAAATSRLGLGSTASTTYYEPFHVARAFQTLDHMSGGRAAWNVVTSLNDGEAANMGHAEAMEHDRRYDRADEFVEVVLGHWDAWEDDALVVDKRSGRFGDGSKVHRLDYKGRFLSSRGPFTVPRSPQGHPVLIQAGASGRGKRFSARWAELVFVAHHDLEGGRRDYAEFKRMVAEAGRDPDAVKVATLCNPIPAATKAEAEDRAALIERLPLEIDALSLLSEALNFDFAAKGMDEPFTDEELAGIQGLQAMRDRVVQVSGKRNPTVRDFITASGRGRPRMDMVGGPKEVADKLEEWFSTGACDGFVISATSVPGTYAEFVRHVVPELQRRGLHRKEYSGPTLRDHLGLPRAERGAWKPPPRAATAAAE
ncbi:LLM class flavin-dependent oxidoreductase [Craurococcus roseus]|uniref:LLM class flavin-dependent oxidoreductase n=1 Tax=Craurococcus roseus TaxID=77585 RepID=A0ABN1F9M8_9PROT